MTFRLGPMIDHHSRGQKHGSEYLLRANFWFGLEAIIYRHWIVEIEEQRLVISFTF